MPATYDDVARMALELPEAVEGERHGSRTWLVADKVFAWQRGLSKADIKRFGDETPPDGPLLAVRALDLDDKASVLAAGHKGFFTIPHFDRYPGFLIQLKVVGKRDLRAAIVDAWLAQAPKELARAYLDR
jgi:hypothetical protein